MKLYCYIPVSCTVYTDYSAIGSIRLGIIRSQWTGNNIRPANSSLFTLLNPTIMFTVKALKSSIPRASQQIRAIGTAPTVAVLHQAIDPPVINGVRKPRKPGGEPPSSPSPSSIPY